MNINSYNFTYNSATFIFAVIVGGHIVACHINVASKIIKSFLIRLYRECTLLLSLGQNIIPVVTKNTFVKT